MKAVQKNKDHINDALIATAAKKENCILVTEDKNLLMTVLELDGKAVSWEEFCLDALE